MEEKQTKVTEDEILFSLNKGKESLPREKEWDYSLLKLYEINMNIPLY